MTAPPREPTDKAIKIAIADWMEAYPETDWVVAREIFRAGYAAAPAPPVAQPAEPPAPDRATNKAMPTLFQQVTGWLYDQQHKHDLGEWYTEKQINAMTNFELLQAISDALKEMENSK